MLFRRESQEESYFLGSCFFIRQPGYALTAAHCVESLEAAQVVASFPFASEELKPVRRIQRHETADVALLELGGEPAKPEELLHDWQYEGLMGADFVAFGYPEDVLGPRPFLPTPRFFKGHIQRQFDHESFRGYRYAAIELSIGVPAGLSGAPIMNPRQGGSFTVFGVAVENLESTTVLHSEEQVLENGHFHKETHRAVINYGVAVELQVLSGWLTEHGVPPR
jgi:hypothetical protein